MESIAQSYQRKRHNVMPDQLLEILSRLFQPQYEHYELLSPIACLQQVVCLEKTFVCPVREAFKHAFSIEVPNRSSTHDVEAEGSKHGEINGSICLLHETVLFSSRLDAMVLCQRTQQTLHEEFPSEGENDYVETHKGEIKGTFAVISGSFDELVIEPRHSSGQIASMVWQVSMIWRQRIRKAYSSVEGVERGRIYEIGSEYEDDENEGIDPCVPERVDLPPSEKSLRFSSLGVPSGRFVRIPLEGYINF